MLHQSYHIPSSLLDYIKVMNLEFEYLNQFLLQSSSLNRYQIISAEYKAHTSISLFYSKKRNPIMSKSSDAITSIGDDNYLFEIEKEETYEQLRKKMKSSCESFQKKSSDSSLHEAFSAFIEDMPMPVSSSIVESDDMKSVMSKASSLGSLGSHDSRMKANALDVNDINDLFPPDIHINDELFWDVVLDMEKESNDNKSSEKLS